jgi:Rod binding domain-containing protein
MDLAAISSQLSPIGLDHLDASTKNQDPAKIAKVSKQFESILLRQFLNESMKPLLQDGPSGQVYGYFLTDSLANEISEGGGIGLAHIIQTQLSHPHK